MSTQPLLPPLDVMAVLADLQRQLDDLTEVVQAQQRTLQDLLGHLTRSATATAAANPASTRTGAAVPPSGLRRP